MRSTGNIENCLLVIREDVGCRTLVVRLFLFLLLRKKNPPLLLSRDTRPLQRTRTSKKRLDEQSFRVAQLDSLQTKQTCKRRENIFIHHNEKDFSTCALMNMSDERA
jgi:hypothetical protein